MRPQKAPKPHLCKWLPCACTGIITSAELVRNPPRAKLAFSSHMVRTQYHWPLYKPGNCLDCEGGTQNWGYTRLYYRYLQQSRSNRAIVIETWGTASLSAVYHTARSCLRKPICWIAGSISRNKQHHQALALRQVSTTRSLIKIFDIMSSPFADMCRTLTQNYSCGHMYCNASLKYTVERVSCHPARSSGWCGRVYQERSGNRQGTEGVR